MEKILNTVTKVVVYLIMGLGVFFTFWTISAGGDLETDPALANKVLNPYFILTAVTMVLGAAAAILFPMGQLASNPKSLIRSAISIGVLALIFIISWSMASDSTAEPYYQTFNITATMSKFIGSMINVVYILGALSILSILVSAVLGMFAKR
ncbi:MAG: hypothetical protein JXR34_05030 [Bacteroidales bacterium]|nr:hypothetical protein [Bacteroidales bacterium]